MLLLELPDEILCRILDACSQLTDAKGRLGPSAPGREILLKFGLASRRVYSLAEPFLLRSFLVRRASHVSKFQAFLDSGRGTEGVKHIRDVALVPLKHEKVIDYREVAKLLPRLPNLQSLVVEIPHRYIVSDPDDEDEWIKFLKEFQSLDSSGRVTPECHIPIPEWSHRLTTCKYPDSNASSRPSSL